MHTPTYQRFSVQGNVVEQGFLSKEPADIHIHFTVEQMKISGEEKIFNINNSSGFSVEVAGPIVSDGDKYVELKHLFMAERIHTDYQFGKLVRK